MAKKSHRRRKPARSNRGPDMLTQAVDALTRIIADVATNPKSLKPGECVRLLNSTPMGVVINDRRLRGHRERAGSRIGDGKTIDLLRYAAWLHGQHDASEETIGKKADSPSGESVATYEAKKERERARNAETSRTGRDVGELPAPADPKRKAKAIGNFRFFCETYFPDLFPLAWSDDHLEVIAIIERAVLEGGLFAMAMPRGSGKTTLAEIATMWSAFTGRRQFVALIGASLSAAREMLDSIKTELETNELLAADFPEVCIPIAMLEGIANRCKGQHVNGQRTRITWEKDVIVLPTIEGSAASGVIIKVAGLTGRVRGMKFKRPDGNAVRPSLVICDDPQTDKSARSELMCDQREKLLGGAVLGLAGPGVKISGVMPITVVCPGDLAARMLDRSKHPQWQGQTKKLLYEFPTRMDLWEQYAELRADSLRNHGDGRLATEFYRDHQKEMDKGAKVAWHERFNDDELSALQHAMNLFFDDEASFMAEYQNDPLDENAANTVETLTADQICQLTNKLDRRVIPLDASCVVTYIDVQKNALFATTGAYAPDFTGAIVDYSCFPDPRRRTFTYRQLRTTLKKHTGEKSEEAAIYRGLEELVAAIVGQKWIDEAGTEHRIARVLIDAGYQPDTVYQFCRRSEFAGLAVPSHGKHFGPATTPMSEWRRQKGDRIGPHWKIPGSAGKRAIRHLLIDTNYWKSFFHERLAVGVGRGGLTLWGSKPGEHRLFAQHLTAENRERLTHESGRTVDVWSNPPAKPDNHWFDCAVGTLVAASIQGCELMKSFTKNVAGPKKKRRRKRVSYLE